jgi:hypothetical protein
MSSEIGTIFILWKKEIINIVSKVKIEHKYIFYATKMSMIFIIQNASVAKNVNCVKQINKIDKKYWLLIKIFMSRKCAFLLEFRLSNTK